MALIVPMRSRPGRRSGSEGLQHDARAGAPGAEADDVSREASYVLALLVLGTLATATRAESFARAYDCIAFFETSVGISPDGEWQATSSKPSRPYLVKLVDLNTVEPTLVGTGGTKLLVTYRSDREVQLVERTPSGSIVTWVLAEARPEIKIPHPTLMQSKTYDYFGPVTFTTIYECRPAGP